MYVDGRLIDSDVPMYYGTKTKSVGAIQLFNVHIKTTWVDAIQVVNTEATYSLPLQVRNKEI